ncbi:MAG: hypothetical protein M9897_10345 [Brumimicrobium sp.]|nr:hypothetical protein [Brumimicrobium sp.]
MCRSFLLIFLMGLSASLFGQVNQTDAKGKKQGKWIRYYANSKDKRYEGEFKDDKPIGKFIYYYPSGKVRAIITHDKVGDRSKAFYYFENDTLASVGIYRGENKDSVWVNFLPSGWPSTKETFNNGKLEGERITYYGEEVSEDGKTLIILRKENYKNDQLNGPFVEYFPDGVIRAEGNYLNGRLNGTVVRNHPNGKVMIRERWKYRNKHGWWETYDINGTLLGKKFYLKGQELEGEELDKYLQECKAKGVNPNN